MERKTIQFFRQQTTSVSKALWPARAQRCVATSRTARRRRKLLLHGCLHLPLPWRADTPSVIHVRPLWPDANRPPRLRSHHLALALFVGMMVPLLCSLCPWSLLPVLGTLSMTLTLVVTHLFSTNRTTSTAPAPTPTASPASPVAMPEEERRAPEDFATQPLPPFPDTPMPVPATPLIRVLETIDLSSSNVEHFLNVPDTSIPQSPQDSSHETMLSHDQPEETG